METNNETFVPHYPQFDFLTIEDMINFMRCANERISDLYRNAHLMSEKERLARHKRELTTVALYANMLSANLKWLPYTEGSSS